MTRLWRSVTAPRRRWLQMFSLNPFRVSSSEYCVTCYWDVIDYIIYFCVCCFVYSNVDVVSVCAAICLGVDAPQATSFNSCAGGSHIVRRHSLCCCAAYNWSRDTARLKLGVQSKIGGAIISLVYVSMYYRLGACWRELSGVYVSITLLTWLTYSKTLVGCDGVCILRHTFLTPPIIGRTCVSTPIST